MSGKTFDFERFFLMLQWTVAMVVIERHGLNAKEVLVMQKNQFETVCTFFRAISSPSPSPKKPEIIRIYLREDKS